MGNIHILVGGRVQYSLKDYLEGNSSIQRSDVMKAQIICNIFQVARVCLIYWNGRKKCLID